VARASTLAGRTGRHEQRDDRECKDRVSHRSGSSGASGHFPRALNEGAPGRAGATLRPSTLHCLATCTTERIVHHCVFTAVRKPASGSVRMKLQLRGTPRSRPPAGGLVLVGKVPCSATSSRRLQPPSYAYVPRCGGDDRRHSVDLGRRSLGEAHQLRKRTFPHATTRFARRDHRRHCAAVRGTRSSRVREGAAPESAVPCRYASCCLADTARYSPSRPSPCPPAKARGRWIAGNRRARASMRPRW
jgi:hypothetical protein